MQLLLPIVVLGCVLTSFRAVVSLLIRSWFFFILIGAVLLVYFLSALPPTEAIVRASALAAAITVKDQLSAVFMLSPLVNVYDQVQFGHGLMQEAAGCVPITKAPLLLLFQVLLVLTVLSLGGFRRDKLFAAQGAHRLSGCVLIAVLILLESLIAPVSASPAWRTLPGSLPYLGMTFRLPPEAFYYGALNWFVLGAWLRRMSRSGYPVQDN